MVQIIIILYQLKLNHGEVYHIVQRNTQNNCIGMILHFVVQTTYNYNIITGVKRKLLLN